ncbi:MAG: glycosyltransferase [Candidatus Rokuibacteriota bacterium]
MIRVLELLTTTALGGGPRQVGHLVRHLPTDEFAASVAGPWDRGLAGELQALRIELAALALDSLGGFPLTLRRTLSLVRSTKADVVHTHGKGAGLYGRLAARLAGAAAVHTFHGIHYEAYSRAGQRAYLALERRLARITHTVINVSSSQAAEALALGVARPDRNVVVVNGIDADELAARAPVARASLGLAEEAQVLGCVARFDPVKRHDLLVRAFALIARRRPNVSLLLVGDGPERARLDALAAAHGIARGRIVDPGELAWTSNPYPSMDLYVTASRKEGLPLAPLEAMASGLAVVATDVPGHRDVVENGATGLLVPEDDDAALAGALESLLDDPVRRRRMGQAGREVVRRDFTIRSMVAKTADVYRAAAIPRAGA